MTTYSRPASDSWGELAPRRGKAPGFHVLALDFYHTALDIPELVPEAGIAPTVRAHAKIIDAVNELDLSRLRLNLSTE